MKTRIAIGVSGLALFSYIYIIPLFSVPTQRSATPSNNGNGTESSNNRIGTKSSLQVRLVGDILKGPPLQNDSHLVSIIRENYLIPPSTKPYVLLKANGDGDDNAKNTIKEAIEKYTDTKDKTGFFIECGAKDGESLSNTLQLEMEYGWTGLLVEANSDVFGKLITKNRKAWLINVCLSPVPYAAQLTFYKTPEISGLSGLNYRKSVGATIGEIVQCFPLYSILCALNITVVDYFSLDIEGRELDILKTIPFDMVTFKVLSVEHWSVPGGRAAVQEFLESQGYKFIQEVNDDLTRDAIYVHNSIF